MISEYNKEYLKNYYENKVIINNDKNEKFIEINIDENYTIINNENQSLNNKENKTNNLIKPLIKENIKNQNENQNIINVKFIKDLNHPNKIKDSFKEKNESSKNENREKELNIKDISKIITELESDDFWLNRTNDFFPIKKDFNTEKTLNKIKLFILYDYKDVTGYYYNKIKNRIYIKWEDLNENEKSYYYNDFKLFKINRLKSILLIKKFLFYYTDDNINKPINPFEIYQTDKIIEYINKGDYYKLDNKKIIS